MKIWTVKNKINKYFLKQGFPGGSVVKNPPADQTQETWVWSLGWEDILQEEVATHSNILAWEITWTEEAGGLHSWGRRESDVTEQTHTYQPTMCIVLDLKTI